MYQRVQWNLQYCFDLGKPVYKSNLVLETLSTIIRWTDRSRVPTAEVVKALRSLVNSVLGHFGPLKKDWSDQRPKWPRTEMDVIHTQYVIDIVSKSKKWYQSRDWPYIRYNYGFDTAAGSKVIILIHVKFIIYYLLYSRYIIQPFCRSSRLRFSITWANFGCGHVVTQCNMPKNSWQT